MKYLHDENINQFLPSVVALGNFDGLHLGHQQLIKKVKEQAKKSNAQSVVFSFYPHPAFIFKNRNNFKLIYTREEKLEKIQQLDIDLYIEYPFTLSFAQVLPEQFIQKVLYEQLQCKTVIVGENFHFGKGRKGDLRLLASYGKKLGFQTLGISPVIIQGEKVSSTRVRTSLLKGQVDIARQLLGEPYWITGIVEKGNQIGRTIGFPTVNLQAPANKLLPHKGVYITYIYWQGKNRPSITNVGSNPTVQGMNVKVESYVLDFDQILYGETIKVKFLKWLRPERNFISLSSLMHQIQQDEIQTREYFQSVT